MEQNPLQQIEYIKRYIRSFYMHQMKMNFVRKSGDATDKLFSELRFRSTELKSEGLIKYLNKLESHHCEKVLLNYYLLEGQNSSIEIKKNIIPLKKICKHFFSDKH